MGFTKDGVIKRSTKPLTRSKFKELDTMEAESNKDENDKMRIMELYYICGKKRDVNEIIHHNTKEIFLPPIKIKPDPLPVLYMKNDES